MSDAWTRNEPSSIFWTAHTCPNIRWNMEIFTIRWWSESVVLTHGATFWLQIPGLAAWMWAQETGGGMSVGLAVGVRSLLRMWPPACGLWRHPVPVWGAVCRLRHVPVFVLPLVSSCSVSRPRGLHLVGPPMLLAGAATGSTTSGYKIILTVQIMGAPSTGCLMINESKCFVGNLCPSQNIETWELAKSVWQSLFIQYLSLNNFSSSASHLQITPKGFCPRRALLCSPWQWLIWSHTRRSLCYCWLRSQPHPSLVIQGNLSDVIHPGHKRNSFYLLILIAVWIFSRFYLYIIWL